jgi:hypothetical protein
LWQWEGSPPVWSSIPSVVAHFDRVRKNKNHQVRVLYDDTNATFDADWYLTDRYLTDTKPDVDLGGTLRDGIPFGIGYNGWSDYPWRLELGCISCPTCEGGSPSGGPFIYWPNRDIVSTVPVWAGGSIVSVNQSTATTAGEDGEPPSDDEISRHHYWGDKGNGKPTETRRCPPDIIVWNHAFGVQTGVIYSISAGYDGSSSSLAVHRADGFTGLYEFALNTSQRFRDVDLTGINVIRLTQIMLHDVSLIPVILDPVNPYAEVTDIDDESYDAINDWLAEGGKTLIIDGSSGFVVNMPAFVAKFCSITVTAAVDAARYFFQYGIGNYLTFRIKARDHALTNFPEQVSPPLRNDNRFSMIWEVSGGDILYDFEYGILVNTVDGTAPAMAVETLASGSCVIVAPSSYVEQDQFGVPTSNWSFGTLPNVC